MLLISGIPAVGTPTRKPVAGPGAGSRCTTRGISRRATRELGGATPRSLRRRPASPAPPRRAAAVAEGAANTRLVALLEAGVT
jgi:hypothetical protein